MFGKKKKRSFIDKLTGSVSVPDYDEDFYDDVDDEVEEEEYEERAPAASKKVRIESETYPEETFNDEVGELAVDVYETPDALIVKAMVAGVRPADLDIDIARDMVIIEGAREYESEVEEDDYYHKELYWGSFKRSIVLPEEVDVDLAEATERHGLLILTLPKVDKARKAKLRVKSEK